jgi:hypothetical protein
MRKISNYEKEFSDFEPMPTEYRGFKIYLYSGGFTYWYGENDGDYVSSIKSIDDAKK